MVSNTRKSDCRNAKCCTQRISQLIGVTTFALILIANTHGSNTVYEFGPPISATLLPTSHTYYHIDAAVPAGQAHGAPFVVGGPTGSLHERSLFIGQENVGVISFGTGLPAPTLWNYETGTDPNPFSVVNDLRHTSDGLPFLIGASSSSRAPQNGEEATVWHPSAVHDTLIPEALGFVGSFSSRNSVLIAGNSLDGYVGSDSTVPIYVRPIGGGEFLQAGGTIAPGVGIDLDGDISVGEVNSRAIYWSRGQFNSWEQGILQLPNWSDGTGSISDVVGDLMGGYLYKVDIDDVVPVLWNTDGTINRVFDSVGYNVAELIEDNGVVVALLNAGTFGQHFGPSLIYADGWAQPREVYGELLPALPAGTTGYVEDFSTGGGTAANPGGLWLLSQYETSGNTSYVVTNVSTTLTLAGDYNRNDTVDSDDYSFWRAQFGNAISAGLGADGNSNSVIDAGDYIIWRKSSTADSGTTTAAVPEPTSALLLAIGTVLVCLRLRLKGVGAVAIALVVCATAEATNTRYEFGSPISSTLLASGYDYYHIDAQVPAGAAQGLPMVVGGPTGSTKESYLFMPHVSGGMLSFGSGISASTLWKYEGGDDPDGSSFVNDLRHMPDGSPLLIGASSSTRALPNGQEATVWQMNGSSLMPIALGFPDNGTTGSIRLVGGNATDGYAGTSTDPIFVPPTGGGHTLDAGGIIVPGIAVDLDNFTIVGDANFHAAFWTLDNLGIWRFGSLQLPAWSDGTGAISDVAAGKMGGYLYKPDIDDILPVIWNTDGTLNKIIDLPGQSVAEMVVDDGAVVALINQGTDGLFAGPSSIYADGWDQPRLVYGDLLPALPAGTTSYVVDLSTGGGTAANPGGLWLLTQYQNASGTSYSATNVATSITLAGDYDRDGSVDADDYILWRQQFGNSITAGLGADGNANGTIDAADYVVWRKNVGAGNANSATAVPEPATPLLLAITAAVFAMRFHIKRLGPVAIGLLICATAQAANTHYEFGSPISDTLLPYGYDFYHIDAQIAAGQTHGLPMVIGGPTGNTDERSLFLTHETSGVVTIDPGISAPTLWAYEGGNDPYGRSIVNDFHHMADGSPLLIGASSSTRALPHSQEFTVWQMNGPSLVPTALGFPDNGTTGTSRLVGGNATDGYAGTTAEPVYVPPTGGGHTLNAGGVIQAGIAFDLDKTTVVGVANFQAAFWTKNNLGGWSFGNIQLPAWSDGTGDITDVAGSKMGGTLYKPDIDDVVPVLWNTDGTINKIFDLPGYGVAEMIVDDGAVVTLLDQGLFLLFSGPSRIYADGWNDSRLVYGDLLPSLPAGVTGTVTDFSPGGGTAASPGGLWLLTHYQNAGGTSYSATNVATLLTLAGDYDRDGNVDADDYALWRTQFGKSTSPGLGADGNNNSVIDAADYIVWRKSLGAGSGTTAAAVPEPTSALLLTIGAAVVCIRLRLKSLGAIVIGLFVCATAEANNTYYQFGATISTTSLPSGYNFGSIEAWATPGDEHGAPYLLGSPTGSLGQGGLFVATETSSEIVFGNYIPTITLRNYEAVDDPQPASFANDLKRNPDGSPLIVGASSSPRTSVNGFESTIWKINDSHSALVPQALGFLNGFSSGLSVLVGGNTIDGYAGANSTAPAYFPPGGGGYALAVQPHPDSGVAIDLDGETIVGESAFRAFFFTRTPEGAWTRGSLELPVWNNGSGQVLSDGTGSITDVADNLMGGYLYRLDIDDVVPVLWNTDGTLNRVFDLPGYNITELIEDEGTVVALLNQGDGVNIFGESRIYADGWDQPRLVYGDLLPALPAGTSGYVVDFSTGGGTAANPGGLWLLTQYQSAGGTSYGVTNVSTSLTLVGDYDRDGNVDADDYTLWRTQFGKSTATGLGADGNSNGIIDAADYVIWRKHLPISLGSGGSTIVPEPSTLAFLFCVAICGWSVRQLTVARKSRP